jgi:hypothetical protein
MVTVWYFQALRNHHCVTNDDLQSIRIKCNNETGKEVKTQEAGERLACFKNR